MVGKRTSAGLLVFRRRESGPEFFLVHPGGPFFRSKDDGWWTVPKGLIEPDEAPLTAAQREWGEETGFALPPGPFRALGEITQKGGKRVLAWLAEGAFDAASLKSNLFEMEWPPRSGRQQSFAEVDRGAWFDPVAAEQKVNAAQVALLHRALELIEEPG